jgi:acetyltransferase-like isoleucine patch superfamily enzyme
MPQNRLSGGRSGARTGVCRSTASGLSLEARIPRGLREPRRSTVFLVSVSRPAFEAKAQLPPFARFGAGSHIREPFTVSCPERITIGANVHIGPGAWLSVVEEHNGRPYEPQLLIEDDASLGPNLIISCIGSVTIGRRAQAGPRVFIGDSYHDYRDPHTPVHDQPMSDPKPVRIGAGAFLGVGSVVLPGVTLGERSYVAANAVVTGDVPANAVVAGNPARVIKQWDQRRGRWVVPRSWRRRRLSGSSADVMSIPDSHPIQQDDRNAEMSNLYKQITELEHSAATAEAERLASHEEVQALRIRHRQMLELLDESKRARAAAEHWLEEHRCSLSWRITAPLRAAKRKAGVSAGLPTDHRDGPDKRL